MVMCFEFQQTEVYQLNDWAKNEANASLKSPRMFLTGVTQRGAGLATSGDWTGVFHLSTEQVLCFRLQCRPAHRTLPASLHPDLEGPAKGEKVIHSPCPSGAYMVSCGWSWGFQVSWGNHPFMEANPCQLATCPPDCKSIKFQHVEREATTCF